MIDEDLVNRDNLLLPLQVGFLYHALLFVEVVKLDERLHHFDQGLDFILHAMSPPRQVHTIMMDVYWNG